MAHDRCRRCSRGEWYASCTCDELTTRDHTYALEANAQATRDMLNSQQQAEQNYSALLADRDRLRAEVERMTAEAQAASKLPWREAIQDQKFEDGDMILVAVPLHEDSGGGYDYAALSVHCDEHYFELKCDDEAWGWTWGDVEFWCPLNRPTARAANAQAGGEGTQG